MLLTAVRGLLGSPHAQTCFTTTPDRQRRKRGFQRHRPCSDPMPDGEDIGEKPTGFGEVSGCTGSRGFSSFFSDFSSPFLVSLTYIYIIMSKNGNFSNFVHDFHLQTPFLGKSLLHGFFLSSFTPFQKIISQIINYKKSTSKNPPKSTQTNQVKVYLVVGNINSIRK